MKKFNKTLAIAIAVGVSVGGFQVPVAGAVAGYDRAHHWEDSTGGNNPNNLTPHTQSNTPTWGSPYHGSGGIYTDVPTSDGELTGFSGVYGSRSAGDAVGDETPESAPYRETSLLRDMKTSGIREEEAPQRDMSMDSKKMLYVAYSFANDIVKNQGLSQETRDKLVQNGYTGEFFDVATMSENFYSSSFDDILIFDKKPSIEEVRNKATTGNAMVITGADYVAFIASHIAGSVYTLDGGVEPVGITQSGKDRPLTFDDMFDRALFYFHDVLDNVEKDDNYYKAMADRYSMAYAMINIARGVSDEEVNNANLKVYKHYDLINPPFFSLSNSAPAPVEDLPQAPVEDTYIEKAEVSKPDKDGNVTATLTYNDTNKKPLTFTIPVGKDGIQDVKVEGGKLVVINADGTKKEFPLTKTTVTEDKAKKTVTIKDDNGNTVTFSTEDLHITDVKKLDNGDYEVTRSDGKKWTISTSELQKQIDDLGSKLDETNKDLADLKETAASKEEVAKLKDELAKHTEQLADHESRLKELEANGATKDDIAALEKEIADNKAAIDRITEQITTIITRIETLEKGVADNAQVIEGLKKDLGDVVSQVEKNTGDIANNSNNIADLRDKVDSNTAEIADLKEKAATKEQLLEVVKQVENHEKRITDLENQGASKEELAKTQAELDELKNKLVELENKAATKADVENLEREIADHADKIAALEKETAKLNTKLVELNREVTERFEKVIERISTLETRADETDKSLDVLGARVTETEVSIQSIKVDITKLGDRIDGIEVKIVDLTKRVEGLEAEVKDLRKSNQCLTTMSRVSLIAAIVGPLLAIAAGGGSGSQANVDIQKQLGIYNPEMAKMMADNQGVIKALSAVAALAAGLGILGYVSDKCGGVENLLAPGLKEKVKTQDNKPAEAPKVPAEAQ